MAKNACLNARRVQTIFSFGNAHRLLTAVVTRWSAIFESSSLGIWNHHAPVPVEYRIPRQLRIRYVKPAVVRLPAVRPPQQMPRERLPPSSEASSSQSSQLSSALSSLPSSPSSSRHASPRSSRHGTPPSASSWLQKSRASRRHSSSAWVLRVRRQLLSASQQASWIQPSVSVVHHRCASEQRHSAFVACLWEPPALRLARHGHRGAWRGVRQFERRCGAFVVQNLRWRQSGLEG